MSKKYRLLKDLPEAKAGDIYVNQGNSDRYQNEYTLTQKSPVIEHNSYFKWQVENNPEWFEEVKDKQVRITVKDFYFIQEDNHGYCYYNIKVDRLLSPTQDVPVIKKAIDYCLNDLVPGEIITIETFNKKKYSQQQMDEAITNAFNAARRWDSFSSSYNITGGATVPAVMPPVKQTFTTVEDYKKTITQ